MRKHYLVLAHDQPGHVRRLVERLDDGESTFWLHLDARSPLTAWDAVVASSDVRLVEPRATCLWGTWSMVEPQVNQLRACLASDDPGYVVALSGQSYPVKSTAYIDRFLTEHAGAVHMDLWRLEDRWSDNHRDRLDYFCIPMSERKGDLLLLRPRREMNARELVGWTRRLIREHGLRRAVEVLRIIGEPRPHVKDRIAGGSQWWAMSWETALAVMAYRDEHPELEEFMRWSQYPDESYFQSLAVGVDPTLWEHVGPTLTHIDWTEGDWDLPRAMTPRDVPALVTLPDHMLFARKFLSPGGDDAVAALDEALASGGAA
ncbi:beta-1,6-N-acetylglucosaminyltransferase [Nocardioides currus]|uniref:beta-1,6-N-acetylglucosaminyltransferase n=1 Tax=Nocardioides currus TaxID=2133958 RepID=UPI001402840A|nr:beta-1,6-N-acetylglucosaminyltransferase [Nocardioides currus]